MLVAWRVKEWLESLLYHHTIAISDFQKNPIDGYAVCSTKTFLSSIRSKPASFFHRAVRQLFLGAGLCQLLRSDLRLALHLILSVCTGVKNLWIWIEPLYMIPLVPLIAKLPLKHFYAVSQPVFFEFAPEHPVFSGLTHLELEGSSNVCPNRRENWLNLCLLPRLTHLTFDCWAFPANSCPRLSCWKPTMTPICTGDRFGIGAAVCRSAGARSHPPELANGYPCGNGLLGAGGWFYRETLLW